MIHPTAVGLVAGLAWGCLVVGGMLILLALFVVVCYPRD